jgi:hypothetical protein
MHAVTLDSMQMGASLRCHTVVLGGNTLCCSCDSCSWLASGRASAAEADDNMLNNITYCCCTPAFTVLSSLYLTSLSCAALPCHYTSPWLFQGPLHTIKRRAQSALPCTMLFVGARMRVRTRQDAGGLHSHPF